jgi:hypothetical protein
VVNNASLWMVQSHEPAAFFLPLLQESEYDEPRVDLRLDGDPMRAAPSAGSIVASLGKQYALSVETVNQRMDRMLIEERMIAVLSGFFGALALLLAVIGLYGVMSLVVTARTSEIGVRMALGAQRGDVIGLILRQVLFTTAIGKHDLRTSRARSGNFGIGCFFAAGGGFDRGVSARPIRLADRSDGGATG